MTPLDYMLKVMRDPKADKGRRDGMAKAAAPYVHPAFSAVRTPTGGVQPQGEPQQYDLTKLTDDELDAFERISRKLAAAFGDPGGETPAGG